MALGAEGTEAVLDGAEDRFRSSAHAGAPDSVFDYYALSRRILYSALALGEGVKQGKASPPKPSYSGLLKSYESMRSAAPTIGALLPDIGSDDVQRFCRLETRRQGSGTRRLYVALGLLAISIVAEEHDSDILGCAIPHSEREFIDRLFRALGSTFNDASDRAGQGKPFPGLRPPSSRKNPEVRLGFDFDPNEMTKLSAFLERFTLRSDGHAHFYLYRSRREHPTQLMKSFLAIKEYDLPSTYGVMSNFQFTHVYEPPNDAAGMRTKLSMGRMVPLQNGVYFIGGQRSRPSPARVARQGAREPFRSLFVMYFTWREILDEREVMYGMGLFPDNDGVLLAARVALVPTANLDSGSVNLGEVDIQDIDREIEDIFSSEPQLAGFPLANPELDRRGVAQLILTSCNNDPLGNHGWDVAEIYQKKADCAEFLTRSNVEHELTKLFGSSRNSKYQTEEGEPFNFWRSIRFGPLSVED